MTQTFFADAGFVLEAGAFFAAVFFVAGALALDAVVPVAAYGREARS